jgi:uncharacterized membrane protein
VPEMKVDDLLKIYVSLGALAPEAMPNAIATNASEPQRAVSVAAAPAPELVTPSLTKL